MSRGDAELALERADQRALGLIADSDGDLGQWRLRRLQQLLGMIEPDVRQRLQWRRAEDGAKPLEKRRATEAGGISQFSTVHAAVGAAK